MNMGNKKIVYKATAQADNLEKTLGVFDSLQKAVEACDGYEEAGLKFYVDRINFAINNIFDREELVAVKLPSRQWQYDQNSCGGSRKIS